MAGEMASECRRSGNGVGVFVGGAFTSRLVHFPPVYRIHAIVYSHPHPHKKSNKPTNKITSLVHIKQVLAASVVEDEVAKKTGLTPLNIEATQRLRAMARTPEAQGKAERIMDIVASITRVRLCCIASVFTILLAMRCE